MLKNLENIDWDMFSHLGKDIFLGKLLLNQIHQTELKIRNGNGKWVIQENIKRE